MNQSPTSRMEGPPLWPARLPLVRPRTGRWLAGTCRGIAMHLGIHVAWVRIAFAIAAICYGAGVVGYLALWMLIPAGNPYEEAARRWQQTHANANGPLARGNHTEYVTDQPTTEQLQAYATLDYTGLVGTSENRPHTGETLRQVWHDAPKPALFAFAAVTCFALAIIAYQWQATDTILLPFMLILIGAGLPWLKFNAANGQLRMTVMGVLAVFIGYAILMVQNALVNGSVPIARALISGLGLLLGVISAVIPWIVSLVRRLGTEQASKEREEERADMTAHLHDGVLQTLALIQLHANEPQQVFTLARSQERELRNWLYQEHTTTDRSVSAGLAQIAAGIEDTHGQPIEVVTVGDARPSAQSDALLDAATQAMINAVTHGAGPISVYCEVNATQAEVFVRDHGNGFDTDRIEPDRLGIRESIIGRMRRRGGTVEIISREGWGTEVRMHMPISRPHQQQDTEGEQQ